ncbi:hypothetical protein [Oceanithermus desulfurans]
MEARIIRIRVKDPNGPQDRHVNLVVPDICPFCHHHSQIHVLARAASKDGSTAGALFQCGFEPCQSVFLGYYTLSNTVNSPVIFPSRPDGSVIPDIVIDISPSFYEIFLQAETALINGLTQIAGPGYRKALEFLIKDYASHLYPDHKDEIEDNFLGKVISEYIKEEKRIVEASKRATWLGNDETHYKRKWEDKDIHDLRELILLVVREIDASEKYKRYLAEMDKWKK